MKRIIIWISLLMLGVVLIKPITVQAIETDNDDFVTIELNHNSNDSEGTQFFIYGISETDYKSALSKKLEVSIDKTKQWLKDEGIVKLNEVLVSSSNKVIFPLAKYNEQRDRMYYVILQSKPDREGINGKDIYESFPSFISLDAVEDNYLSIETKRVFMYQTPYFFKYSSGTNQRPLSNAEFILYQETSNNERKYLVNAETMSFDVISDLNKAWRFKSDNNGLVILPNIELAVGSYFFEETKSPEGYKMTLESKKIPLVISEDSETGVSISVKGEKLKAVQAGELPNEVIKNGTPRVLNDSNEIPPKNVPPGNNTPPKSFLPKTGESIITFSSFGLLLIFIAFRLMKRGKENE